jgi:hypothetical protein
MPRPAQSLCQALQIIAALLGGGAGEAVGVQQGPSAASGTGGVAGTPPPALNPQDIQQLVMAVAGSTSNVFRAAVMHLLSELLQFEVRRRAGVCVCVCFPCCSPVSLALSPVRARSPVTLLPWSLFTIMALLRRVFFCPLSLSRCSSLASFALHLFPSHVTALTPSPPGLPEQTHRGVRGV